MASNRDALDVVTVTVVIAGAGERYCYYYYGYREPDGTVTGRGRTQLLLLLLLQTGRVSTAAATTMMIRWRRRPVAEHVTYGWGGGGDK